MKIIDEWEGCYPSQWKGRIVSGAIAHPAKFSSKLIQRIYEHMISEGWLKPGDLVIDPFGGVALGAFDAMAKGLRWRGIELEPRFAELGNQNINLWNSQFHRMPGWSADAILLRGDSRKLIEVLQAAEGSVTSPPYAESEVTQRRNFMNEDGEGQPANKSIDERDNGYSSDGLVSSPPYTDEALGHGPSGIDTNKSDHPFGPASQARHGNDYTRAAASLASPPFADTLSNDLLDPDERKALANELGISNTEHVSPIDMEKIGKRGKQGYSVGGVVSSSPYSEARIGQKSGQEQAGHHDQYGPTSGQLGAMKADGFDGAIASPPFRQQKGGTPEPKPGGAIDEALYKRHAAGNAETKAYGQSKGQLANMGEGDFDASLASPPYGGMPVEKNSKSVDRSEQYETYRASGGGQTFEAFVHTQELHSQDYGNSEGQLSHMPDKDFDGSVTSPPYLPKTDRKVPWGTTMGKNLSDDDENRGYQRDESFRGTYSLDPANLGNPTGADLDNFWMAARQIIEQVYFILRPGAHAVWVVKGFVKNKQLIDFPGQWAKLCEAVGFETVHEHHAMLVHRHGTSHTLDGGTVDHKTESKSFFRRNGENQTRAAKYWKDIPEEKKKEFLGEAYLLKWTAYEEDKQKRPNIKPPTDGIIQKKAHMLAWKVAGSPDIEIPTAIDHETVLCMVKPTE
jgi:hypothetical protein